MARPRRTTTTRSTGDYRHDAARRKNNPPVGIAGRYYDRRTFHICHAFFPNKSAWQKLARALKGTLNEDLFDQLTGRVSLPFEPGEHRRIAVKVIDQRGNEVMRVVGIPT